jgi:hypothetical protein
MGPLAGKMPKFATRSADECRRLSRPEAGPAHDQGTTMASRRFLLAVFASVMLITLAIAYGVETGLIDPDYTVTREANSGGGDG